MTPALFKYDIDRLRGLGWSFQWHSQATELPREIHNRYPWLPQDYLNFVRGLDECTSPDDTRWILSPSDLDIRDHHAFNHDAWEQLSLNAADGDEILTREIRQFWDTHIPICLDVRGGYSFHAIRVGDQSGVVVTGREPEFEDSTIVASSFTEFLSQLK